MKENKDAYIDIQMMRWFLGMRNLFFDRDSGFNMMRRGGRLGAIGEEVELAGDDAAVIGVGGGAGEIDGEAEGGMHRDVVIGEGGGDGGRRRVKSETPSSVHKNEYSEMKRRKKKGVVTESKREGEG